MSVSCYALLIAKYTSLAAYWIEKGLRSNSKCQTASKSFCTPYIFFCLFMEQDKILFQVAVPDWIKYLYKYQFLHVFNIKIIMINIPKKRLWK